MERHVWFGTREHMQWVPAPLVDVSAGKQGFAASADFTNGGAWVRRSKASAKRYEFSWNLLDRQSIQPIVDYADGVYGDGLLYYSNPMWADWNVAPGFLASPYVNAYDGPWIFDGVRPDLVNTGSSQNGYPVESAVYAVSSTSNCPEIYIPIPPGYTAHVGAHGSVVSGSPQVRITKYATVEGGTTTALTLLDKGNTRVNDSTLGNEYRGIGIHLGSASTGVLQLDAVIVQILPDGKAPATGGFRSGQGQTGMEFRTLPEVSEYSAKMDKVGVTAALIETEAWTWR